MVRCLRRAVNVIMISGEQRGRGIKGVVAPGIYLIYTRRWASNPKNIIKRQMLVVEALIERVT